MHPGKLLIAVGLLLVVLGLLSLYAWRFPFLGKLPGDIYVERGNFRFFFPLGTSLAISALVTLFLWLFRR
jgi:hypothetical protein